MAKYYIDWDTQRRPREELYSLIGKQVAIHESYQRGGPYQGTLIEIEENPDNHGQINHFGAFDFILEVRPGNRIRIGYSTLTKMIETIE